MSSNTATTTTTTTTALVLPDIDKPLLLRQVQLNGPLQDEVLVEIQATGICHTDLSCMNGTLPISSTPAVLGHEGAGIVLSVGTHVQHVNPGDKVLLSINHCGGCVHCSSGHPNYCVEGMPRNFGGGRSSRRLDSDKVEGGSSFAHTIHLVGNDVPSSSSSTATPCFGNFFGQSSFSRLAIVNGSCAVKVPRETDLALFAPLGCGISTGVGCVLNTLDVQPRSTVAVFGAGSVGLAAVMAARLRKADVIIAVDLRETRLELAKNLGATHVICAAKEDVLARINQVTKTDEGVNYAVDCTGVPAVIETMMDCLAIRGRAAQVGIPTPDKTVPVKILQHLLKGQQYVGCAGGDCVAGEMIPYLLTQQKEGKFPLEKMVSYYDVKDHQRAFDDVKSGKVVKAVISWDSLPSCIQ